MCARLAWPSLASFLILSQRLGLLGLGLGLIRAARAPLKAFEENCMTNKFCVSQTVDIFYAELYDAVWQNGACNGQATFLFPSLSLFPAVCSCLRIRQLPSKILIFINASHMQSWQLLKRTNCPSREREEGVTPWGSCENDGKVRKSVDRKTLVQF